MEITGSDFSGAQITTSIIENCMMPGNIMVSVNLSSSTIKKTFLIDNIMNKSSFSNIKLIEANFNGSHLIDASLDDSIFEDSVFREANLKQTKWFSNTIEKTLFFASDISDSVFYQSDMRDNTFKSNVLSRIAIIDGEFTGNNFTNNRVQNV